MTESSGEPSHKPIQSVDNSFDILEYLLENGEATVTDVANDTGVSLSTAYSHLMTLADRQYVEKVGERYRLGVRFLTFGGEARAAHPVFRTGERTLDELGQRTGETARLVVERDGCGITLCQSTGGRADAPRTFVGSQEPLHSTAAGKALLAHYSRETVEELLDKRSLSRRTDETITNRSELLEELDRTRNRGLAFDVCEHFEDVICVAGPVIRDGEVLGAVSLSAPTRRRDESWLRNEAASEIRNATGVIKVNSTYSSWVQPLDERESSTDQ